MGRLSKNLSGVSQAVIVTPDIAYTDDTTYTAFVNNAPEGEIGVFLDSGAVRTTALTAGLKFFIAQKRDGSVNKTPIIEWDGMFRRTRTAYTAQATKVMTLGWNGTSGSMNFDFTGATLTTPITLYVSARETTPGNQPFPIQEGAAIVTSTTQDQYGIVSTIVANLNQVYDYERTAPDGFVTAEVIANGAKTTLTNSAVLVQGSVTVTSTAHAQAVGALVSFRTGIYKVATVVDANTITLDRPYTGVSETLAAGATTTTAGFIAYTSGTTALGIRFTAILPESHFVISGGDRLTTATVTTITNWVLGAGYGTAIVELEKEARFFDGVGSPVNAAFSADYGLPTLFASSTLTYDQIFLDFASKIIPTAAMGAVTYEQKQIERLNIATVVSSTSGSVLQTVFGL